MIPSRYLKEFDERNRARPVNGSSRRYVNRRRLTGSTILLCVLCLVVPTKAGWNWGSNEDPTLFGNTFNRDWMYDATALSLKIEGCVWSYVNPEDEDAGCMEQESEDGTTYWYWMSNCKRAQVAFSLYASDSGSSVGCNSNSYKETFVTQYGLAEFLYYLSSYDSNNPFSGYDDDDGRRLEGGGYGGYDADDLPVCDGDNGYMGIACGDDGTFVVDYFNDQYCLSSSGTYDYLSNLNSLLSHYSSCGNVYNDNGNGYLAQMLVPYCASCTSLDSPLCTDDSAMSNRLSTSGGISQSVKSGWMNGAIPNTWATKIKYGFGCLLLLASFVMFTGILFTNRRRRRALMQRKFRQQSRSRRSKSRSGSRSKSRNRDRGDDKRSRSSKSRSKSRTRRSERQEESGGVYT